MDMPATTSRQSVLSIDLGQEQVVLERVQATEALGKPFQVNVDLVAPLGEIDIFPHLGTPATVRLSEDDEVLRYFHGLITEAEYLKESSEGIHYRLILRPWTYYMSQNREFSIFQDLTVLDILKKVFLRAGVTDVDYSRISDRFVKRDYCVQYGESDFAFVSRLMEEEGIYYFFHHEANRHKMILCNSPSSHVAAQPSHLSFNASSKSVFNNASERRSTNVARKHQIQTWVERVVSGGEAKVTTRDFDFQNPERAVEAKVQSLKKHPRDAQEIYAYPIGFVHEDTSKAKGIGGLREIREALSQAMLEALRAERKMYVGQSQSSGLSCGGKIKIDSHPHDRFNTEYLITETFHSITSESYRTGQSEDEDDYNVMIEAIPATTPWRSVRSTPRPVVHGLESAIVTGPSGEQIYTDEFGRVKVRFHWDRSDTPGEKSTCWIRVSQTGGLGNVILPRVGHEVLVDFLGGDPDRPVVVGRVFNKQNPPVYDLPAHKTRALWRSLRYKDAGSYPNAKKLDVEIIGGNEMRFEDKGGEEEIFVYAERDMKTRIRNIETHHVGADQTIDIGHNRTEEVGNDESITIGNHRTEKVAGNETIEIKGNQKEEITGERKTVVKANDDLDVKGSIKIKAGTTIELEAGVSITIKVGGTSVKLDASGVSMKGPLLKATADAMLEAKAPMTQVKGDGMLILKGGITMIN